MKLAKGVGCIYIYICMKWAKVEGMCGGLTCVGPDWSWLSATAPGEEE